MIVHQLERIQRATRTGPITIVTSTDVTDDRLAGHLLRNGFDVYRGSLNDVLDRYYQCARSRGAETIVRLTADCPLLDPEIVDLVITRFYENSVDYASNTLKRTYPDGLDVEVFTMDVLETAWREARTNYEREHVTPFIYSDPDAVSVLAVTGDKDLSHLSWTVDEMIDFRFVERIYEALYSQDPCFSMQDILDLIEARPELCRLT